MPSHGSWLSGENQIMDLPTNTLRGKLILDGGSLAGSFFHRSVLLICQHDEEGAFGLILNRPLSPPPATASPFKLPNSLKTHSIFFFSIRVCFGAFAANTSSLFISNHRCFSAFPPLRLYASFSFHSFRRTRARAEHTAKFPNATPRERMVVRCLRWSRHVPRFEHVSSL